jgi:hypothetical protein
MKTPPAQVSHSNKYRKPTSVVVLNKDGCGTRFVPQLLDRDCNRAKAMEIRASLRWIDSCKFPNGGLNVPFIDELGRFTGLTLHKWSCDPRSLFASVVATILKRLVAYARKHNKNYIVKRNYHRLCGAAIYYAMSRNLYFWDRVLFFTRDLEKKGNLIHKLRLFFSCRWDDNKRFVYGQASFQANWLLFRAAKPRDKSHFYGSGVQGNFTVSSAPSAVSVGSVLREIVLDFCWFRP